MCLECVFQLLQLQGFGETRVWQWQGFCSPCPHEAHDKARVSHVLQDVPPFLILFCQVLLTPLYFPAEVLVQLTVFICERYGRLKWAITNLVANSCPGNFSKWETIISAVTSTSNIYFFPYTLLISELCWEQNLSPFNRGGHTENLIPPSDAVHTANSPPSC